MKRFMLSLLAPLMIIGMFALQSCAVHVKTTPRRAVVVRKPAPNVIVVKKRPTQKRRNVVVVRR